MELNPYLTFDGNCEEALTFYAGVFGGEITSLMRFSDMPDTEWVTDENKSMVAHASLQLGDREILASDTGGMSPHKGFSGVTLQTGWPTVEEGKAIFDKLSEGGKVEMDFAETFWAKGFGMCRDRFGVGWMVNCDK
ncbi:VOC family protein [Pseudoruegeria sp. HB172150]|uniref:VOC family protein n=1 Tax=Pseudoruegeria sp. HB172150 TaxID=2721164 RepID=UPI0015536EBF|nr:VOC family protein [Pseudoruegeria sp. HB172150]